MLNLIAYMARYFNLELFFFFAEDIDFENKLIHSTLIEGKTQTPKIISFPKIIFNIPEAVLGKDAQELKMRLEKEGCYFVRPVIGLSKQRVYDILSNSEFKTFLIESHTFENFEHFLALFEQYNHDIIIKPSLGGGGAYVTRISFENDQYIIRLINQKIFLKTIDELKDYYYKNFTKRAFILQPYIVSRTKQGHPFDIRIHVLQAPEEKFTIILYPRIGNNPDSFISNFAAGGYTCVLTKFLKNEFGDDWKMLRRRLMDLGNKLTPYFLSFFDEKIFALGIDVGIQRRGDSYELKIFEVNHRSPGMSFIEIPSAFAILEYLQYLCKGLVESTADKV